ncbi:hypothetical protein OAG71_00430 [bacterium]|nr:hypothetical protein [bacterium]
MIDLGYMAKRIAVRPEGFDHPTVQDIYAVSDCISEDFCDYVSYWQHNGFWFYDSETHIRNIASKNNIDLSGTSLLFYRGHDKQFDADKGAWLDYAPDSGVTTNVTPPSSESLVGFDVVTYSMQGKPECSPLSCNYLANEISVNKHCLIETIDMAIKRLETGLFNNSEPGPYRIIAVSLLQWSYVG